jgi:uncharacterized lipoprotein
MMQQQIKRAAAVAGIVAVAALGACDVKGGREHYNKADEDTGQAAPAAVPTPNSPSAPDSTAGVSQGTGKAGPAGDRQGQNSTAAIPHTPAAGKEAAKAATGTAPSKKP